MNEPRVLAARPALALALALSAAGCTVGPDFHPPAPPAVAGYRTPADAVSSADAARVALGRRIPAEWWRLFRSPPLDETLRQAIAASNTLAAARATLAAAREAVVAAGAARYPQVDLGASARRGAAGTGAAAGLFSLGPSVSFSLDAFGGTRRRIEEATAQAEVQRDQLAAAYLALTGNFVAQAIAIAAARAEISTVEDLIANDEKNLDLVRRSFDAGKVARSEVLTAQAQLEGDRTQLPGLRQQLAVARHALAVLAGRPTGEWAPPDFDVEGFTPPDELPLTLPSELIHQRPDILAAEAALHAASAGIGVATAARYPSISLSASLSRESGALARLLRAAAGSWTAGADLAAPLFRGGALDAQRRAAVDAYDAQLAAYRQVVLAAFGQVADVLSALEHDGELAAAARRSLDIASASLALQRSSYAAGKTSALQLISAENAYSSARLANVRALSQRLADTAQLFVATGGGWQDAGDDLTAAPTSAAPP